MVEKLTSVCVALLALGALKWRTPKGPAGGSTSIAAGRVPTCKGLCPARATYMNIFPTFMSANRANSPAYGSTAAAWGRGVSALFLFLLGVKVCACFVIFGLFWSPTPNSPL